MLFLFFFVRSFYAYIWRKMDRPTLLSSNSHFLGSLSDITKQGTIVGQQALAAGGNTHPSQGSFIVSSDTPFQRFHPTMANGHISTFILPDVPQRNETHNHAYIQSLIKIHKEFLYQNRNFPILHILLRIIILPSFPLPFKINSNSIFN